MKQSQHADIEVVRAAASISTEILRELVESLRIGDSATDIDNRTRKLCQQRNVIPAFLGVGSAHNPFPGSICVSINNQILHSVPRPDHVISAGDVVKLDFGIIYQGIYTDHCVTVGIAPVSAADTKLINVAKLAVETAVSKAKPGNTTGDLGNTMFGIVNMAGFDVLKEFVGHGIGHKLHLPPEIPAYGTTGDGDELTAGQVICVEAQVVAGSDEVDIAADGWTVTTSDGANAAMFEYMVHVTAQGPEILTDTRNWPVIISG